MSQTWENAHARGIMRVGTKPAPAQLMSPWTATLTKSAMGPAAFDRRYLYTVTRPHG